MNRRRGLWTGACAGVAACALAAAWWMHGSGTSESEAERAAPKAPPPKVVVDETEHDFGFLDAGAPGRHVFLIRNEGEGPLRLQRGGTSCKCTMSHLPEGDIAPGATAEVELATKYTATKDGVFRHTANILTNDPERETVTLTVRGVYRVFLAAKPDRIEFPQAKREGDVEPLRAEVTVYSQAYEQFDLSSVSATLEGVSWEIEPLAADVLEPLEAKSGYRIAMVLPDDLADEGFSHTLHVSVLPTGEGREPRTLAIPLSRRAPGSIELSGPDLTLGRTLLLGTVLPGNARRSLLTLKVGVEPRALNIRSIEVEPAFVQVRMAPLKPDAPQLGLYRVEVEVPGDSPMGNYRGPTAGSIRIETDHSRVPEVNLGLEFAVAGT